ncbi:MAG: replication factor C small subunit [Candidatus Altiarchaeota archaeon]|nr:replication factor C small subunit [Candidatus Altiarchaeota archaeon]
MTDFTQIWTEKYRPNKLQEMIGQKHIVGRLKAFLKQESVPHMLFAGPPGVGKTTAAIALARELFGEFWHDNYLELNASDERGIDVVRVKVKDFARTKPIGGAFKIIFLDEADALTKDAQQALRRTMEKFSNTCRFILSCNYPSKIIEPIQSRTVVFRFKTFTDDDITNVLKKIATGEKIEVTASGYTALVDISNGDARYAVNLLQSVSATSNKVDAKEVYEVSTRAKPEEIEVIIKLALNGKFSASRKKLLELLVNKGLSGDLILKEIHSYLVSGDLPDAKKAELINIIGEFEFRILEGATELIQLDALLAKFASLSKEGIK